jgi:transcriptional regulator of arginine metabolism
MVDTTQIQTPDKQTVVLKLKQPYAPFRKLLASPVYSWVFPREALAGVLRQFGLRATAAQNIVVVQSELGSAPAIARALDRLEHPKIVGTLAGDDTCLVITSGPREARTVARELGAAIG